MAKPIITFQVDTDQAAELMAFLNERGIKKRSPFLREAVFAYIHSDKPELTRAKLNELKATRRELANVGNNLNQVAYKLNAGFPVSNEEIKSTQEELQRFFAQMVRVYRRLEHELRR